MMCHSATPVTCAGQARAGERVVEVAGLAVEDVRVGVRAEVRATRFV